MDIFIILSQNIPGDALQNIPINMDIDDIEMVIINSKNDLLNVLIQVPTISGLGKYICKYLIKYLYLYFIYASLKFLITIYLESAVLHG